MAERVDGSLTAVAMVTVKTDEGTTEQALVVRARLHDGQEFLLHWELLPEDCRNASTFFAAYADAQEQHADDELREILSDDTDAA